MSTIGFFHRPFLDLSDLPEIGDWHGKPRRFFRKKIRGELRAEIGEHGFFGIEFPKIARSKGGIFNEPERAAMADRLEILNAFLGCFYAAAGEIQRIGFPEYDVVFDDVFSLYSLEQGPAGFGGSGGSSKAFAAMTGKVGEHNPLAETNLDPRSISLATVERTFVVLDDVLNHRLGDASTLVSMQVRATSLHGSHRYSHALVVSWACAERCLAELWSDHLAAQKPLTNGHDTRARLNRLKDARTYSAAVQTEMLFHAGAIDETLYIQLQQARKARNDWVHALKPVSPGDSEAAWLANHALLKRLGLPVPQQYLSYRMIY